MKKITVIIPCFNEEKGIRKVLESFPFDELTQRGYIADVMVVDNNSTDHTARVAAELGARLIQEPKYGKGNAVLTGFAHVPKTTSYVVMLDGDNTYKPAEILRMIEPLESRFCQVVVGSRLGGKMSKESLAPSHRLANWMFTFMVRHFYLANVTDALSGYFAFRREVIDVLLPHLVSSGFALEMEMITKCNKLGFEVYSVPITYDVREGKSKLHTISDGFVILGMLLRNLTWTPNRALKQKASMSMFT